MRLGPVAQLPVKLAERGLDLPQLARQPDLPCQAPRLSQMLQGRGAVAVPPAKDRQRAPVGQPQAPVLADGPAEPLQLLARRRLAAAAQQGLHLQVAVQRLGALYGRFVPEPRGP